MGKGEGKGNMGGGKGPVENPEDPWDVPEFHVDTTPWSGE